MIQEKQISSVNAIIKQFKEMDAIIVGNETYINAPPPVGFVHAYEVVNICKDPAFKEVYPQKGGGLSLTAVALKKLGKAMGIKFGPGQVVSRILDENGSTKSIIYRSTACCRGLDGQFSWSQMDYEFDVVKRRQEIENTQNANIAKFIDQPLSAPPDFKVCKTRDEVKAWRDEKVRIEMIQIEKNALTRAQTGSMTRCIRDLGAFPSTYMPKQLEKPFLVPKLVVYYEATNPIDRAFALEQTKVPMMMFPTEPTKIVHAPKTLQLQAIEAQRPSEFKPQQPTLSKQEFNLPTEVEALEIEHMIDPQLTETEMQIENQEMQLTPIESSMMDFETCDLTDKIMCIEQLIRKKNWKGKLNKDFKKFTPNEFKNFYMMLLKLANPEHTQSDLPWNE